MHHQGSESINTSLSMESVVSGLSSLTRKPCFTHNRKPPCTRYGLCHANKTNELAYDHLLYNSKDPKLINWVIRFPQVVCLGSHHFEFTSQMNNPTALQNEPTSFTEAAKISLGSRGLGWLVMNVGI